MSMPVSYLLDAPISRGVGREGPRWEAPIIRRDGNHKKCIGRINEDGNGGELRIDFFFPFTDDEKGFREAVSEWAHSIAPANHKCVSSVDAWVSWLFGTPVDELVTLFFAADVPPPTRPSSQAHFDNAIERLLHTLRFGHAMMASIATYGKASTNGRQEVIDTLVDWHSAGWLDTDDWRGLQDFSPMSQMWAAEIIGVDTARGVEPIPSQVTILTPKVDYDAPIHQPLPPSRLTLINRKPTFGEPRTDRGAH